MSIRGWPGLTLFSINHLSACLALPHWVAAKRQSTVPRYVNHHCWFDLLQETFEKTKACVGLHKKEYLHIATVIQHLQWSISCALWWWSHCNKTERTGIREPLAESSPVFPHATGGAQYKDPFCACFHHISRGGLIQQPCLFPPLCLLTQGPSPGSASSAIIITGVPQSVIYKSKTL